MEGGEEVVDFFSDWWGSLGDDDEDLFVFGKARFGKVCRSEDVGAVDLCAFVVEDAFDAARVDFDTCVCESLVILSSEAVGASAIEIDGDVDSAIMSGNQAVNDVGMGK